MTMRESFTAVLERNTRFSGEFATEPYEVAWAGEARWFVRTLERVGAEPRLRVTTQVSPDGLNWCDLDAARDLTGDLESWTSHEFGGWLRLKGTVVGGDSVQALVYLALKS